ncbi:MAG: hypothetical protein QOG34_2381 [Frankiaceae bacterium]|nr:hypothetical protein [Frankiaceae bacterium]
MKNRVMLAAVAFAVGVGAAILPAAPASAAFGSDSYEGGCFFNSDSQATVTAGRYVGHIGDLSVTTDRSGAPTFATFSCWIIVNGVEAPGTRVSASGTGVQAAAATVSYVAGDGDWVEVCEQVVYGDGTTESGCPISHGDPQLPPPIVIDALTAALDALTDAEITYVDPVVCPVFVAAAGSYGPVTIAPDGDVYLPDPYALGLTPVYDCPPYLTN